MTNIILCGGSGTRLWPISRTLMPKQFVKLFNDKSLFQLTVERNIKVCDKTFIVSNTEQYFLALDQIEEVNTINYQLSTINYLLEPIGRNTAPAIALSCMALDKEEILLVTPSDHLIKDEKEYQKVIQKAKELAKQNYLVTFGITPTEPNTGYGYIEANEKLKMKNEKLEGLDVVKFHEKPDIESAKQYLKNNSALSTQHSALFFWNSGMFCFKAGVFLEELQKYSPDIYEASKKAFENAKKDNIIRVAHKDMLNIPSNSIDYAVMEKSNKVKVIPSDIDWSDVGSFDSLIKECEVLSAKCYEEDSKDNFYYSDDKKKVIATIGLEDYIVVDTKDALLISKKGQTQKVKNIVQQIKHSTSHITLNTHSLVHRPWGTYETLIEDKGYKIKRIVVKPGKRLSLQKHFHRNEHWIVVSGTATVTVGDETKLIRPNESTYIKMGEIHRLGNEGKIPVVLIEAQVGEYTGEDDIVRIEDDYKRI